MGGNNGRGGRDDDPVEFSAGGTDAVGPDLPTLLVRHRPRRDSLLFQRYHAHHDAFLLNLNRFTSELKLEILYLYLHLMVRS
jgi:hypothetical protein